MIRLAVFILHELNSSHNPQELTENSVTRIVRALSGGSILNIFQSKLFFYISTLETLTGCSCRKAKWDTHQLLINCHRLLYCCTARHKFALYCQERGMHCGLLSPINHLRMDVAPWYKWDWMALEWVLGIFGRGEKKSTLRW